MWIFFRIFNEHYHCQTGACKIDFSPILLRPARYILLRLIWGTALHDIIKGQSARTLHMWRVYHTIAAYIAWRADQVLYGSYPLDIYIDNDGLCVTRKMARTHRHRMDSACCRRTPFLHRLRTASVRLRTVLVRIGTAWTTEIPLSKRSQYGLKRYANGLKRYSNGASTASVYSRLSLSYARV